MAHRHVLVAIVLLCSVIAPITKLVATLHVWYRAPLGTAARALGRLAPLGKLAMAELFLLAVVIVGFKGVGVGRINPVVPAAWIKEMNQYRTKIVAGTLKVPTAIK